MIHARRYVHLAVVLLLSACASGQTSRADRPSRDLNALSRAELEAQVGISLYDMIQRSRPNWLRTRGPTSLMLGENEIAVYRDGQRIGGPAVLRDVAVESVERVVFLSGPEASSRFGLDHDKGAILITTRIR